MKPVYGFVILGAFVLSGCNGEEWVRNSKEAVRISAFDSFRGGISIAQTENVEAVCKTYRNDLNLTPVGVGGAVPRAEILTTPGFYHYKSSTFIEFFKGNTIGSRLTTYESPVYFRLPRTRPNEQKIKENSGPLSIAQLSNLLDIVSHESDNTKTFTHEELSGIYHKILGEVAAQNLPVHRWVASLFTERQNKFLECVPKADQLKELAYSSLEEDKLRKALTDAEAHFRSIGSRKWLF
jgi:hypothetical protein